MKNPDGTDMTREQALDALTKVLIDLAKHSVYEKRMADYADQLEQYIVFLDAQAENAKESEKKPDDNQTE